ncbi:MAG: HD domain-containing protein [Gemmatimonadota bacterium]
MASDDAASATVDTSGPRAETDSPEARLLAALHFAADRHRDQRRKGEDASPYINHPIVVAETLARHGVTDPVTLEAAILHDTLEDTETTPDEIEQTYGPDVRDVVLEVTDDKGLSKRERRDAQIREAAGLSRRARLVRIADKISNVHDVLHAPPTDWPLEWRLSYIDWTERVVERCRGTHAGLEASYDTVLDEARSALDRRARPRR